MGKYVKITAKASGEGARAEAYNRAIRAYQAELALSPEELQALLEARGSLIQFSARAYQSLRIRQPQKLMNTLNELGILPRDLAACLEALTEKER